MDGIYSIISTKLPHLFHIYHEYGILLDDGYVQFSHIRVSESSNLASCWPDSDKCLHMLIQ